MSINNKKAIKSGAWYTASSFLIKGIGFLTTPIFTRLLSHEEFGIFNNYQSWLNIMIIFGTMQLESTLISARYDYKKEFDSYVFSVLVLSNLITISWMLCFNIFSSFISNFMELNIIYINAMLVYLIAYPAVILFQTRERYLFEYKKTVTVSILVSVGTALLSVLFVVFFRNKLDGRILGAVLPTLIVGFFIYIYFIKIGKRINVKYWKYALPIAIPFIPHLLSLTVLNSMDRIMITKWCGSEFTAVYSLAYNCGAIVTMLGTSFNSAFSPWLAEKLSLNKRDEIRAFSKIYIGGFSFITIGIILIAPDILMILGGSSYIESKYVMPPVALGCLCQFIYTMFVNVEQFKKKTVGMAIASVFAAIVNFFLNYLFIPQIGYLAAAYTTLVGFMVLLFIHMYLVHRLKLSNIYSYKYIFLVLSVSLVLMIGITLIYNYSIVRYAVIVIYLILLLLFFIIYKKRLRKENTNG